MVKNMVKTTRNRIKPSDNLGLGHGYFNTLKHTRVTGLYRFVEFSARRLPVTSTRVQSHRLVSRESCYGQGI